MKPPSSNAIHEAAHAVVARLRNIEVGIVSTKPGEGWLGHTTHQSYCARDELIDGEMCQLPGAPEDEILVCFAGYAAEMRLAPNREKQARAGSGGDDKQAAELLAKLGSLDERPYRQEVSNMIAQHWQSIYLVALEPDKWETLDQEELDELINLATGKNEVGAIVCLVNLRTFTSRIKNAQSARQREGVRLQKLAARVRLMDT
jgi:hypothetical protein